MNIQWALRRPRGKKFRQHLSVTETTCTPHSFLFCKTLVWQKNKIIFSKSLVFQKKAFIFVQKAWFKKSKNAKKSEIRKIRIFKKKKATFTKRNVPILFWQFWISDQRPGKKLEKCKKTEICKKMHVLKEKSYFYKNKFADLFWQFWTSDQRPGKKSEN